MAKGPILCAYFEGRACGVHCAAFVFRKFRENEKKIGFCRRGTFFIGECEKEINPGDLLPREEG